MIKVLKKVGANMSSHALLKGVRGIRSCNKNLSNIQVIRPLKKIGEDTWGLVD